MSKKLALGGVALGLILRALGAGPAQACTCSPPRAVVEAVPAAVAVFVGIPRGPSFVIPGVVHKGYIWPPRAQIFEVKQRWKGAVGAQVTIMTPGQDSACGRANARDVEQLVFAEWQDQGYFWNTKCGASGRGTADDLAALGPGLAPVPTAEAESVGPPAPLVDVPAADAGSDAAGDDGRDRAAACAVSRGGRPSAALPLLGVLPALARRRSSPERAP